MSIRDVVVLSAVRSAIGSFGGSLAGLEPAELAGTVMKEAVKRSGVDPQQINYVTVGNTIPTDSRYGYVARVASIQAGLPMDSVAMAVNRLCSSGLQGIVTTAQNIMLNDCDYGVGGGVEVMSKGAYLLPSLRNGARMGDTKMVDMMVGALHDPFHNIHMGVTAENVAAKYGITREMQDALAVESHNRAERATTEGRFKDQIVPVMLKSKKGEVAYATDEHFRPGCKLDDMTKLKPVFLKENGTVTAGNASGINDAAAAVLLMDAKAAQARGAKPLARLVGYAHTGLDPKIMGVGPISATQAVLKKTGLSVNDLDVIEANEAFAAQACAVTRELGLDPAKVNPNGSGISLGHPIGATGALITVKALYELQRVNGRYALVTMCIGGGQGIAAVFERL